MPDQIPHWQSLLSKRPNCNWPEGDDDGGEEHLDVDNKDAIAVDNKDVVALENIFLNGLGCDCDSQAMVKPISSKKAQTQLRLSLPLRLRLRATRSKMALTIQLMWQGQTIYKSSCTNYHQKTFLSGM